MKGAIGTRLTIDQIVLLCKPVLDARRFGSIAELTTAMKERFPAWFVGKKMNGEIFVKRMKWVYERLGGKAWSYLRTQVRSTQGKGVFTDSLVCNPKTLLPADKTTDTWRNLTEESQLLLYKRLDLLGQTTPTINPKIVEKIRIACIAFYHMQDQLQNVRNGINK